MRIIILCLMIFFSKKNFAQNANDLTIKVSGYKSLGGTIFIALYNSEENYMNVSKASFLGMLVPKELTESYTFHQVPDGIYAATLFYDENGNGKLDRRFFGIPKEKIGFSNNAKGFFGPAKFRNAKFNHNAIQEISVTLE